MVFHTFIPVTPTPKARARTVFNHGKVRSFTPQKTVDAQELIKWHLRREFKGEMIKESCEVVIVFSMPFPASWSKNKQDEMLWLPHTSKPDIDNMEKLLLDSCNEILWKDDGLVWKIAATKIYARVPMIEFTVIW